MKKYLFILSLSLVFITSCAKKENLTQMKEGNWYGEFITNGNKIPFVFEVDKDSLGTAVTLKNGSEKVVLQGVLIQGDTVVIPIEAYDTEFRGILSDNQLRGKFKRLFDEKDQGVDFTAEFSTHPRFETNGKNDISLQGKWSIQFISEKDTNRNVGIFDNKDGILTGSILTNSGDLRFLEGVTDKDGFRLSAFAGLSPYLIKGNFIDDNHFEGEFVTIRGVQKLKGLRDNNASLDNPYTQTSLKNGFNTLNFDLEDLSGKKYSLSNPAFKNKVVVISILGSWCPNCLDEMQFLVPWYNANKDRGVEVIGISFERKDDPEYVNRVLTNLIKKHQTTYPILIGGKIGDESAVFPELTQLKGYPTTIFIDKKGNVRKIHTGFNGPATGLFYDEFQKDFNQQVDNLLNE